MCDVTTTIDAFAGYRALNIGHAAAIILYMATRGRRRKHREQGRRAREVFARSFNELAEASRVPKHKTRSLFEVGKRVAATSGMTDAQLNLLAGVFRKAVATIATTQDRGSKT